MRGRRRRCKAAAGEGEGEGRVGEGNAGQQWLGFGSEWVMGVVLPKNPSAFSF